jgi:hypothetical protein
MSIPRALAPLFALLTFNPLVHITAYAGPSPTPNTILHIGDSQCAGFLGKSLDKELRARPEFSSYITQSYCVPGATPLTFIDGAKTDWNPVYRSPQYPASAETVIDNAAIQQVTTLKELIAKYPPQIIIIQLGGNLIGRTGASNWEPVTRAAARNSALQIMNLVKKTGSQCFWIGPPDGKSRQRNNYDEANGMLKSLSNLVHCTYVDLKPVGYSDDGDGIHPINEKIVKALSDKSMTEIIAGLSLKTANQ